MPSGRRVEAARLVVVYGVPHSGTTILQKMVCLHPDVTWFSQYSARNGQLPGRRRLPLGDVVDRNLRRVLTYDWHKEEQDWRGRLVPRPGEATYIFHTIVEAGPIQGPKLLRRLVSAQCRVSRRPTLVCKPLALGGLQTLASAFPGAPLLHILRDGRAVALSLRARSSTSQSPLEKLEDAARFWCSAVGDIASESGLTIIPVSYESLCDDVHGVLADAVDRAGLDSGRYPFDRLPRVLHATNESRLTGVDPEELKLIEQIQRPLLEQFGYLSQPAPLRTEGDMTH